MKTLLFVFFFSILLFSPFSKEVFAQCQCDTATHYCVGCVPAMNGRSCTTEWDCSTTSNPNCTLCTTIEFVFKVLVPWVFGIGVIAALVFLVIGGIRYIMAGDDQKKITDARGTITWSVIGFIIIILAAAIIRLVWVFWGVDENQIFKIPWERDSGVIDCSQCS